MSDFINKVISVALIFVMLVVAPLLISYRSEEAMARRLILNDASTFIQMVRDTGKITEADLDVLYMKINSHGIAANVTVKRLVRTEVGNEIARKDSEVKTVYYSVEDKDKLKEINRGDVIKLTVEEIGISSAKRLVYNILKIDEGQFKFSLAGAVG